MRNFKWYLCILTFFFCVDLRGQQVPEGVNTTENTTQQPIQNSTDGQQTADTTAAGTGEATQASGQNQETDGDGNNTADARASNTPAVQQTTSSQSGSPAVLSGESGNERDGTNNVQRASMNMVGSPAENLNLDENETVNPDSEMQDRQDNSQEKQISAQE